MASGRWHKAGNLVGITWGSGEMVVIDRATGAGSLIATTNSQFQDVGIDERTGDVYAVRHIDDGLYSIDPATGVSTIVGTFGPSFPVVRGFDLTDGYGTSLARTLLLGTSCGGMSANSQTPPRFSSDWELYLTAPQGTQFGGVAIGL